jgi:hypothetical protein
MEVTYNDPVMRINPNPTFCLIGICTFHSSGMGKNNMPTSVKVLNPKNMK